MLLQRKNKEVTNKISVQPYLLFLNEAIWCNPFCNFIKKKKKKLNDMRKEIEFIGAVMELF